MSEETRAAAFGEMFYKENLMRGELERFMVAIENMTSEELTKYAHRTAKTTPDVLIAFAKKYRAELSMSPDSEALREGFYKENLTDALTSITRSAMRRMTAEERITLAERAANYIAAALVKFGTEFGGSSETPHTPTYLGDSGYSKGMYEDPLYTDPGSRVNNMARNLKVL